MEQAADIKSAGECLSETDGVVQIAFDLTGSPAGYLIISTPRDGSAAESEFFGLGHYVEVRDQLFGQYGGLSGIAWEAGDWLEVSLRKAVPDVGSTLRIKAEKPMSDAIIAELHRLRSTFPTVR